MRQRLLSRKQTRNQTKGERGQALTIIAILASTLLGFMGLLADSGQAYGQRRHAQSASDNGAIAAASVLLAGGSDSAAESAALSYAMAHGFEPDEITVHIPPTSGDFAGNPDYAEVIVEDEPETVFIHVIVPDGVLVQGRGVAGVAVHGSYAIYAAPGCEGDADMEGRVLFEGGNSFIDGGVHGDWIDAHASGLEVTGPTTYVCTLETDEDQNFAAGPHQLGAPPPPPVEFEFSDFTCTVSVTGNLTITDQPQYFVNNNPSTKQLKPGVYCATGNIVLEDGGLHGNVTFVAHGDIELQAGDYNFTAYQHNVFAFTDADNDTGHIGPEIELEGSDGYISGMLIAPYGEVELEGSNLVIENTLLYGGHQVHLEGQNLSVTGDDDLGIRAATLVE